MTETVRGAVTLAEILQQPQLWPTSLDRVREAGDVPQLAPGRVVVSGAGTSAYAASAIAASLPGAAAIPTTDLLAASEDDLHRALPDFADGSVLISIARSGNSPESVAVVDRLSAIYPRARHLAITCNADGKLAKHSSVQAIVLDPRSNDRSLAMTSSFSNLTLAGFALVHRLQLEAAVPQISQRAAELFPRLQNLAATVSASRVVILATGALGALAQEAALKVLEMTAGGTVAFSETFLGLRHGPMSFLRPDAVVLCVASSDAAKRSYEEDLLQELRGKGLGRIVAIAPEDFARGAVDVYVPPIAPDLPDHLRTPFEIPFAQFAAYSLSLTAGLDPDNPSPEGVITRVVQSFRIHEGDRGV